MTFLIDTNLISEWVRAEPDQGWSPGRLESLGKPIGAIDAFLAATADLHGFTLVTRNERDFSATGISVVNP
jgi:predicted nucleic acid-binding protein